MKYQKFIFSIFIFFLMCSHISGQNETDDILTLANGAMILEATSEYNEQWAAMLILDDTADKGWSSSADRSFPHEITIELGAMIKIDKIGIINSPLQESVYPGISARGIEIWGSENSPNDGFEKLVEFEVAKGGKTEIQVPGHVETRWLKVVVTSNWGNDRYTEIMEITGFGEVIDKESTISGFSGVFDTNYGLMRFEQQGSSISGCYDHDQGILSGSVQSNVTQFEWKEDGGTQVGTAIMILSKDGNTLNGLWYENGIYEGLWKGVRELGNREPRCEIAQERDYAMELKGRGRAIIYGIYFDIDSHEIRPESVEALNDILTSLRNTDIQNVIVEGHTDNSGDNDYNKQLSLKRAESVVSWLVEHGIDESTLQAAGQGEEIPVADNNTQQGRALNRRVELLLGI